MTLIYNNPTVGVAIGHIEAQGVAVTPDVLAALIALHAAPRPDDENAVERSAILGSEHLQHALNVECSGSPQTITFALLMLDAGIAAGVELREKLEARHE